MSRWLEYAVAIATVSVALASHAPLTASAPKPAESPCSPRPEAVRAVTELTGARSARLDDGTEIVLRGIIPPTSPLPQRRAQAPWPLELKTIAVLQEWLHGRSVGVAFGREARDRYGRRPAHLFVRRGDRTLWVQAEMVAAGLAQVDTSDLANGCARVLLAMEQQARRAGIGLWGHATYRVRQARQPNTILRDRSTFQIVEGRVLKAARIRNRVYINFGTNWRTDFTIGMSVRMLREVERAGFKLPDLEGRRLRVRGWIQRRGGPFIYLRSPLDLEFVHEPRTTDSAPGGVTGNAPSLHHEAPVATPSGVDGPAPEHRDEKRPAPIGKPGVIEL